MSTEERLEFLLKSTESLHASLQELHGSVQELHGIVQEHTKQLQQDSENIRALARIAQVHEQRISDIEDHGKA